MLKKLRGFQPWQVAVLAASVFGFIVAVGGSLLQSTVLIAIGFGIAILGTLLLLLLFSRQTWRQLKKLDAKVGEISYGVVPANYEGMTGETGNSEKAAPRPTLPPVGLDNEWARRMPHVRPQMETFALRSKSVRVRDAVALAATSGMYKYKPLREMLTVADMGMIERQHLEVVRSWNKDMLLTLARLAANQRAFESDMQDSARLFNLV